MRLTGDYFTAVNQFYLTSAAYHLNIVCDLSYPGDFKDVLAEFNFLEGECKCSGYRTSAG